jgi:hypothetical protein
LTPDPFLSLSIVPVGGRCRSALLGGNPGGYPTGKVDPDDCADLVAGEEAALSLQAAL